MADESRRQFLRAALGAAVVSVPGVLAGCSRGGMRQAVLPAPARLGPAVAAPRRKRGYFEAFGVDQGAIERTMARGLGRGADFCEVYLQHRVSHWVTLEDGEVNRAYTEVSLGAGIRTLRGDSTGYAFSEDLAEAALLRAAEAAAAIADGPARAQVRPLAAVRVPARFRVEVPWAEVGTDRKLPLLEQADRDARSYDASIVKVTASLQDETSRILIANSEGRLVEQDLPLTALHVTCVGQRRGKTETSHRSLASRDGLVFYSPERVRDVARQAADYTVILFDAEQPPAGEYPVVLAPGRSGILLHEAIGHGLEGDFNRKGVSIYTGRMGQRVAPAFVSIIDDGTEQRLPGSLAADDEGTLTERTVLVENGVLRSYLHDRVSARHYGASETGSGRRESFRFPPVPRMRNTYMAGGPHRPEEVVTSVKKGLYAEVFANGQVNIGAGDFSFYLKHGRMIEDGKLTRVVKDANLIGSGPRVLERVEMVADDLTMDTGAGWCGKDGQLVPVGFGLPTTRVSGISVGGKQ